jgi:hypothetical protein
VLGLDDEFSRGGSGGDGESGGRAFEFGVFPAVATGGEGGDAGSHEFPADQDDELLELGVAEVMDGEAGHEQGQEGLGTQVEVMVSDGGRLSGILAQGKAG